jgi:hypothetical protein
VGVDFVVEVVFDWVMTGRLTYRHELGATSDRKTEKE